MTLNDIFSRIKRRRYYTFFWNDAPTDADGNGPTVIYPGWHASVVHAKDATDHDAVLSVLPYNLRAKIDATIKDHAEKNRYESCSFSRLLSDTGGRGLDFTIFSEEKWTDEIDRITTSER